MILSSIYAKIVVGIVLLLPLIVWPPSFNPYEFPKFVVFAVGIQVVAFLFFLSRLREKMQTRGRVSLLSILVASFGALVFLSDLVGVDPKQSFLGSPFRHQGYLTLISCMLVFFILHAMEKRAKEELFRLFQRGIQLTALALCALALYQAIASFVFHDPAIATFQGRIVATMGNPNFLGGYLASALPFMATPPLFLLVLATIVLTQSRSALAAALLIVLWHVVRRSKPALRWQVGLAALGIVLLLVAFQVRSLERRPLTLEQQAQYCLFTLPRNELGKTLFALFERYPSLLARVSFCEDRFSIWQSGFAAVAARPLLGIGQENFEYVYPKARGLYVDSAHNVFLEIAVASGLAGLVVFIALVIVALKQASPTVFLSILAFLLVASFNPLSIAQIALFWLLISFTGLFPKGYRGG